MKVNVKFLRINKEVYSTKENQKHTIPTNPFHQTLRSSSPLIWKNRLQISGLLKDYKRDLLTEAWFPRKI
jgi:hypothetical protein